MQRLWLTVDHSVQDGQRSTWRPLVGLPTSLAALALSTASHHLLQISLPYGFSLVGVVLAAAWGGTVAGLTATVIGVPGAVILGSGSPGVTPVNTATITFFCVAITLFGGRVTRLNAIAARQTTKLRQRESYLQTIFRRSPAAMLVVDADGEALAINAAARDLFAVPEDETGPSLNDLLRTPAGTSIDVPGRGVVRRVDGTERHIRVLETPLPFEPTALRTIYVQDETDAFNAAARSARLQAELQQLGRATALGQLGSAIAHELNQPLACAANFASVVKMQLEREFGAVDPRVVGLDDALCNVFHASEILKRLRNFVRHAPPLAETVDVRSILIEAGTLGELAIHQAGATFHCEIADDAGQIRGDAVQIQQVILNLLVNAAEAVAGRELRTVRLVAGGQEGDRVMVQVIDSGCGIDATARETLFLPFHTSKAAGLGVGLAISKTIVEAHGGTIDAQDEDAGGTRFTISLPRDGVIREEQDDQ